MSKGQFAIPKRIGVLWDLNNEYYVTFVVNQDKVIIQNSKVLLKKMLKNEDGEID